MHPPSIFNDVIGPVMRGPSSSHTAAALRIGRLARDLMEGDLRRVTVRYDPDGSLATTHDGQGSDMGLQAGLLGWQPDDPRMVESAEAVADAGIDVEVRIEPLAGADHPNTYDLELEGSRRRHRLRALSLGGGKVAVVELDGVPIQLDGACYATLLCIDGRADGRAAAARWLDEQQAVAAVFSSAAGDVVQVCGPAFLSDEQVKKVQGRARLAGVRRLAPVMPVLNLPSVRLPFSSYLQMMSWSRRKGIGQLADLAVAYEAARAGWQPQQVVGQMEMVLDVMARALERGMAGTGWDDRILHGQAACWQQAAGRGGLLDAGMLNDMVGAAVAVMEAKSAMEAIVAAPTAGSCAVVPAAVLTAARRLGGDRRSSARALLAAGLAGVFIAAEATFAAEEAGCQAECGAASAMAAAALVDLAGGKVQTAMDAASMALQNLLGLICDPVAGRVEVPCMGRNVAAVANALCCANMALAGLDPVIPFDETVRAMARVGGRMAAELRCTGGDGLSVCASARQVARRLEERGRG